MRGSRRRLAALAAGFTLLSCPLAAVADGGPHVLFRIQPSKVDESSSLVVSQTHPGLVYTANDSGDSATVYVLDDQTGELVGSTSIEGVDPLDIEAMTPGGHGSLIVADIGDNDNQRPYVTVYRIDEPDVGTNTVTAQAVRVTYANGPHNAEAVVYNVGTGRLYIASKQFGGAHVYRSPPHFFAHREVVMRAVAKAPALATDAALLPGGDVAVIRTYFSAFFFTFPGWRPLADHDLPNQPQGESLAVPATGDVMWIGSEGEHSRVIAVQVPDLTPTTPPPTTPPPTTAGPVSGGTGDVEEQHRQQLKSQAVAVGAAALALFVIVIVAIAVRWRRHPHVEDHRD
ncbi:MAG TPA: hypothetical protein VLK34_02255 [Nocardioidaceae bacterium]|nr:hypothetical protein [Nocardioidaceae bacterium]